MKDKKTFGKRKFVILAIALVSLFVCIGIMLSSYLHDDSSAENKENTSSLIVRTPEEAAIQLAELGDALGYKNALSELKEASITTVDGDNYFRLQQTYHGIPVYGRSAVYVTDKTGKTIAITGNVQDVDEDIDLSPTVTTEQLAETVKLYFTDVLGLDDSNVPKISIPDKKELYIYNLGNGGASCLAYKFYLGNWQIIADAHGGCILSVSSYINDAETSIGYMASDTSQKSGFNIERLNDSIYILNDTTRNLKVYTLNGTSSGDTLDNAIIITSSDIIFGNEAEEIALEAETGAALLLNCAQIHDCFCNLGFIPEGDSTLLFYNDAFDEGCNARGGYGSVSFPNLGENGDTYGLVIVGSVTGANDIDVLAHEYAHRVSRQYVNWIGNSVQNSALNEAFSDILAESIEAKLYGNADPDWVMQGDEISVYRNIANPRETGFMQTLTDVYAGTSAEEYGYSTVISHAAYLMWNGIDGNKGKMLSTDDLAKLWYRAMLMMPSDCDFYECRSLVELAAQSMDLTANQLLCISEAFDAVGITDAGSVDYEINKGAVLNVYGSDGKLYENYTISIAGVHQLLKEDADLTTIREQNIFLFPMITEEQYYQTIEVTSAEDAVLDLDVGTYSVTIIDSQGSGSSVSFKVRVGGSDNKEHLEIYTDFNADELNTGNNSSSNNTEDGDTTLSYDIGSTRGFSDGAAWVEIRKKEDGVIVDSWWACIDTTGDVLFELSSNTFTPSQFENGVAFYETYDEDYNVATYNIIDKSGNIAFSSKDGLFDAVIAQSGGCFAVYTYTESFKDAGYSVFFLNSRGEVTTRMEGLHAEIPELINCGEGVFAEKIWESMANLVTYRFYNTNTGIQYEIGDIGSHTDINNIFHNGYAVIRGQRMGDAERLVSTGGEVTVLSYFGYGRYEFGPVSDGGFVCTSYNHRDEVEKVWFYDIATDSITQLGSYGERVKLNQADDFYFDNGHMLLPLIGADGKNYYTIIDKLGNSLFEPTVCESAYAEGDDRIVVKFADKTVVYNGEGEAIFELPVGQSVDSYEDGIARIVREDYSISNVYIDLMGNVLLDDEFLNKIQNAN